MSSATSSSTPSLAPASPVTPAFPGQDCLACRLTGAGAFSGLGLYALNQAHQQGAFKRVRPVGAPIVAGKITAVIGTVFLGLGIGRLFI
ncbi:hypothetical protein CI109_107206 [Kwoniella shandongensis]|uniref:Distal membrane-arm assembly complex protein 1-like domain-containing protein n=1 Tax=Kwoniella shandongensis TaxID=1734106 RepID=A0A5M6C1Z5_9TREE|nr:uncharacterized protein CI109_002489 [Kwoniella shandongensis]KAA5529148.1 hypothetical protein CI109_002489 [Kwoniella shandongensis]